MPTNSGDDRIVSAGVSQRALAICRGTAEIDRTPSAIRDLVALLNGLRDVEDASRYLQGGVLARLQEQDRWRQLYPDFTFAQFCEEEEDLINEAIETAAVVDKPRTLSRGYTLNLIALDWLANNLGKRDQALRWLLAQIKRVYGVEVAVVDPSSN